MSQAVPDANSFGGVVLCGLMWTCPISKEEKDATSWLYFCRRNGMQAWKVMCWQDEEIKVWSPACPGIWSINRVPYETSDTLAYSEQMHEWRNCNENQTPTTLKWEGSRKALQINSLSNREIRLKRTLLLVTPKTNHRPRKKYLFETWKKRFAAEVSYTNQGSLVWN